MNYAKLDFFDASERSDERQPRLTLTVPSWDDVIEKYTRLALAIVFEAKDVNP